MTRPDEIWRESSGTITRRWRTNLPRSPPNPQRLYVYCRSVFNFRGKITRGKQRLNIRRGRDKCSISLPVKLKAWFYLRLRSARPWVHLRWLAMTCAHFGRDQNCTQVDESFSLFGHPIQVNASSTCDYLRVRSARACTLPDVTSAVDILYSSCRTPGSYDIRVQYYSRN